MLCDKQSGATAPSAANPGKRPPPSASAYNPLFAPEADLAKPLNSSRVPFFFLRKVGIDPIFGKEVLVWDPNGVKGQHAIGALDEVMTVLRQLDRDGASRGEFAEALRELGKIAARRGN